MSADTTERRPFLFDLDFGAPENQADDTPEVEEEPPAPTFSEEELQAAKQDGYNTGHADGIHEAIAGFEHRIAESLDVATAAFSRLAAAQAEANEQIALDGLRLAATVVEKMMPELVRRHGVEEIESAVADVLENIIDEPSVTVTVHEDLMEPMAERLRVVGKNVGLGDRLLVIGDPTLGLSDCRVSWGEGGAERNADAIWSRVDETLDRNLTPTPEEPAPAEPAPEEITPEPAMDIPDAATNDVSPPVEFTNDAQTSETPPLPDAVADVATQPAIPSEDVSEPSKIAVAPDPEIVPDDINAIGVPDTTIESAALESPAPIIVEPPAPNGGATPELPGSITPEPSSADSGLPGAVTPGLPGAVTPGLPGAVRPVAENPGPEGESA